MSPRALRAFGVMVGSALMILVAGAVYLRGGVTAPPPLTGAGAAPTPAASPRNGTCPPTELKVTGAFLECISIENGQFCPASFDQAKVIRLHGPKNDFLLYVEIKGGYQGPGTYQLRPWPHASLGEEDGMAKVALREYESGQFFESVSGLLIVDNPEGSGWVYAGLGQEPVLDQGMPAKIDVNLAGWWSCS